MAGGAFRDIPTINPAFILHRVFATMLVRDAVEAEHAALRYNSVTAPERSILQ